MDTKNHFRMMRNRFDDTIFGVDVYDRVLSRINSQMSEEEPDFDIRALHLMYDHKVLMLERLKYLMANDYMEYDKEILDEYKTVVVNMLAARNLLVRISITGDTGAAVRFKKYFNIAKEKEVSILLKVLSLLDNK